MAGINPNFVPQSRVNEIKLESEVKQTEITAEEVNELTHENMDNKSDTISANALDAIAAYNQGTVKMVSVNKDTKTETETETTPENNRKVEIGEVEQEDGFENNKFNSRAYRASRNPHPKGSYLYYYYNNTWMLHERDSRMDGLANDGSEGWAHIMGAIGAGGQYLWNKLFG